MQGKRKLVFIDTEVGWSDKKVHDVGALSDEGATFHSNSIPEFLRFVSDADFLCGHNAIHHDLQYLFCDNSATYVSKTIDTLYLSPLLFPKRPYHNLLKDDKLQVDELNNPLNDCSKARDLFHDEIAAFTALPLDLQIIYCTLLYGKEEFKCFFDYVGFTTRSGDPATLIQTFFKDRLCVHADVRAMAEKYPVELAYSLALISVGDTTSITPPWLLRNFPEIENVLWSLRNNPCEDEHSSYCRGMLDIYAGLKKFFGYDAFRTFDGEPMQEQAVSCAVKGESLLCIFPTGGGKSLTFQLPALMAGRTVQGLTVVISPLQSLMKDQVDNLVAKGWEDAVTINGMLDPVSRAEAYECVANGMAKILYIAPELLRSKTLEKLLLARNVVRIVIDEAHCFSSWGHDFRVDYLYIADFIKNLQEKKRMQTPIPVSCFTATAKQKVISDIHDYFMKKLGIELKHFASSSDRKNLRYSVMFAESEDEKYNLLRNLMVSYECPTIVYVSRTSRAKILSERLTRDGYPTLYFHGKMDSSEKVANQNAFMTDQVRSIVATSAFGMGVDKSDVGLVVHYDISDSLENYVQEAGRAGRNPEMEAKCYVLYSNADLDKHFILLNQTKLSIGEIQQVWSAIKSMTKQRNYMACSPLEIARAAGWDDSVQDMETRIRTAVSALEDAGYIKRGYNIPHVFATGIKVRNMDEATSKLNASRLFNPQDRENAVRIIKSLISAKYVLKSGVAEAEAESRVDYLADRLGMTKQTVISVINLMKQEQIIADVMDMSAFIDKSDSESKSNKIFQNFIKLEEFVLDKLSDSKDGCVFYKELNDQALKSGLSFSSVKSLRTILYFLSVKRYLKKSEVPANGGFEFSFCLPLDNLRAKYENRRSICSFLIKRFYEQSAKQTDSNGKSVVQFSLVSLLSEYNENQEHTLFASQSSVSLEEMEESILYLSKIGALKLEGGFMVVYNTMEIRRLVDSKYRYKMEDYRLLDEFYKQKIRQVHIVGEYANLMVNDYNAALQYVRDYFQMDFKRFISKYFEGERAWEIEKNITPKKYEELFGRLSGKQLEIIKDSESKYIVVAAGPGSGKTMLLVHKLASLLCMEDVKHEQLLMLTFSRAAATEFKKRLLSLIGNAAYFVEIKTFHSYCFDLIGKIGNLDDAQDVVSLATQMIQNGEVEACRINKSVLVIDEAQDMDANEFALVAALMQKNEDMRVIAVGDDDQNIYQFRGADSKYMRSFIDELKAKKYEMTDNFRSCRSIVSLSNEFAKGISERMKTAPIVSMSNDDGFLSVTQHVKGNMFLPFVDHVASTYHGENACVLTNTNEEALLLVLLLSRKGLNAKLVQSLDGFRFSDLAEIRYFLKQVNVRPGVSSITDEEWNRAKEKTVEMYEKSACLELVRNFFEEFEAVSGKVKYKSDLNEFVFESSVEDFYKGKVATIYVSTIHKSKGREFDSVYLYLSNVPSLNDDVRRRLYVGLTRAKHNLYIHCESGLFAPFKYLCTEYDVDNNTYSEPNELVIQLSHRDVFLDFFKNKKKEILSLRSGASLCYEHDETKGYDYLKTMDGVRVVSLSKKKQSELAPFLAKGYNITSATVRYIVAWKGKEDEEESAVILADLRLCRD